MATLNFPTSPALNDTYSFNGKTWVWNGEGWQLQNQGAINGLVIGNVTPAAGTFTALSATGNVSGNVFIGNGSQLTGITSSYGNANVVANLAALGSNPISTTGNVTAGYVAANGSLLTNITGANVTGTVANATYATSAGTATSATTAGTVTGNAQANITSVGILSSLSVSGNITGGNVESVSLLKTTDFSITGNVTSNLLPSANITYDLGSSTQRWKDLYLSGNSIYLGSQTISANATSVSLGASTEFAANNVFATNQVSGATVSATGNITGNVFIGNGSQLTGITSSYGNANVVANLAALGSNPVSTTGNITGGNLITSAAISAASVSASGNVTGGNVNAAGMSLSSNVVSALNVTGAIAGANVTTPGLISATGNITGGNILGGANVNATTHTGTTVSVTGNITGGNLSGTSIVGTLTTAAQPNITSVGTLGSLAVTANVAGGNITTGGQVSATGNVTGGNVNVGNITIATDLISSANATITIDPATVGNAGLVVINGNLQVNGTTTTINSNVVSTNDLTVNYANNAINAAAANGGGIEIGPIGSPFITWLYNSSANVFTSSGGVSAVGNVIGGNITSVAAISAASVSVSGNITGGNILGGANVNATTHTGTTASLTGNVTGGNILTAGLISATGAVTGAAITGTSLSVSTGNITAGNLLLSGAIVDSAQLDIQTSAANANIVLTPNGTGNVNTGANISVTGNVQGGNLRTGGQVSATGNITGGNILGGANVNATTHTGTTVSVSGNVQGGNLRTAGLISATGNITGGSLTVSTGNITGGNIVNAGATGVGNIGNATVGFNTVFAKATSAQYADLAEYYSADADYPPGTVLSFGGNNEVTVTIAINDPKIAGVVSTNPAHVMNAGLDSVHAVMVALAGRVPTLVIGAVAPGDMMVSAGGGRAKACAAPVMGTVIGKALQAHPGGQGVIEVVIGRI